jgi:hypothetical protein
MGAYLAYQTKLMNFDLSLTTGPKFRLTNIIFKWVIQVSQNYRTNKDQIQVHCLTSKLLTITVNSKQILYKNMMIWKLLLWSWTDDGGLELTLVGIVIVV